MRNYAPDTLERPDAWLRMGPKPPCAADPELFFSTIKKEQQRAAQMCMSCPLQESCAQYAQEHHEQWGTWGGVSKENRRKPRPKPEASAPAKCETSTAYFRHHSLREQCVICDEWHKQKVETERRQRLAGEHEKGGTLTGYQLHRRLGELPCEACREANRVSCSARRQPKPRSVRVPCPVCGIAQGLTPLGLIRRHGAAGNPCAGSGTTSPTVA